MRRVRFDDVKSPAASRLKTPPTPYHITEFENAVLSGTRKGVRFERIKSPAVPRFRAPPTPYYEDNLHDSPSTASSRSLEFELEEPPIMSWSKFSQSPCIDESNWLRSSSSSSSEARQLAPQATDKAVATHERDDHVIPHQRVQTGSTRTLSQLRSTMIDPQSFPLPGHSRSRETHIEAIDNTGTQMLPGAAFDENAVAKSTLEWLGTSRKPSYHVRHVSASDKAHILGRYFHRSTTSI
jgi:hypothetical protein